MIITDSNIMMASSRQFSQTGTKGTFELPQNFINTYEKYVKASETSIENVNNNDSPLSLQNNILRSLMKRMMSVSMGVSENISNSRITYQEYESTSFSASGQAHTADGRTIDFNMELFMSRSYMEYTNTQVNPLQNALRDPLVINVDSDITRISDQKFMFDIDSDGQQEEISMLNKGSGFLAIDKNNDGVINDGSELFGTKTGNGFADLAEYDSDGNGWIDEADDVFSKLKVWCKGENGEDILMNLKEAGVGAIYLGNQSTEFSSYGFSGLNGVIRSTGFFLKENGGMGTIQHVDMAVTRPNDVTIDTKDSISSIETVPVINLKEEKEPNVNDIRDKEEEKDYKEERKQKVKKANEKHQEKVRRRKKKLFEQQEQRLKERREAIKKHNEAMQEARHNHSNYYKQLYKENLDKQLNNKNSNEIVA